MTVSRKLVNLLETPVTIDELVEQEVPMLSPRWGAKDEDALIHTLGINLFAAMGRRLGFFSLVEFPVPRAIQWQRKLVRVDSAWFDISTRRAVLLSEFERLSMDTDQEKLTNLYVGAHGCEVTPDIWCSACGLLMGSQLIFPGLTPASNFPFRTGPMLEGRRKQKSPSCTLPSVGERSNYISCRSGGSHDRALPTPRKTAWHEL